MKILSLLLVLVLHSTGLITHLSPTAQDHVATIGTSSSQATNITPAAVGLTFPLPVQMSTEPLVFGATSAIAIDRATGTVLYSKNSGAKLPIASVTKMITALVYLSRHDPKEQITVPVLPAYPQAAEIMGLVPGDTFTAREILQAALVPSDNDAADTLAISDAGSVAKFAARMNQKMTEWGISDTRFVSASGLQDEGNYASATALSRIAALVMTNPTFAELVKLPRITLTSGEGRSYNLTSTNALLASGLFYGIKTGYTQAAGECFVGLTRINDHEVITVVLGSNNRFGDTTALTNWIGHSWQWL